MRTKLIVGNWKMNGSRTGNAALLEGIVAGLDGARSEAVVCAPAPYLQQCEDVLSGTALAWGAQDVSVHCSGAYTGEVCAAMLAEFGCKYVIVGHSERRAYHAEHNSLVAQKTLAVLAERMIPIVCVGETLAQREAGLAHQAVGAQLDVVLDALDPAVLTDIVVAYEPIWAIGTGMHATPEIAQAVHEQLRGQLAARNAAAGKTVRIVYGGSMRPDNAKLLLSQPDIDGGLIGGAALKAQDFLGIIHAV